MRAAIAIGCFFLSGVAGLVYQICWIREASLVFGSTTFSVSTVVAVFFLGLAVGAEVAGRLAPGTNRPLRIYAILELILAALAAASPFFFGVADRVYGGFYASMAGNSAALTAVRVVLVATAVFLPTVIMGATLPLLTRAFVRSESRIAASVGMLYGVNTAGAALGCAVTGLVLLPVIGLKASLWLGAGLNVVAGLLVLAFADEPRVVAGKSAAGGPPACASGGSRSRLVAGVFFLAGIAALGYEVLWTRYLSLLVVSTVHTYTIAVAVVLTGIVIGSFLAALLFDRLRRHGWVFGALFVLTGIFVVAVMSIPPGVWKALGEDLWVCFVLLLPPAVLSGAGFPVAVRLWADSAEAATLGTGRLFGANTLGGILGALLMGFVVLPRLGLQAGMWLASGISVSAGVLAWMALAERGERGRLAAAATAGLLVWIGTPRVFGTRIPQDFLAEGSSQLVEFREGLAATMAVIRDDDGTVNLKIDRWWQGSNRHNHQAMAAHIPMILMPDAKRVLVVGAGTGQTAGRFLMHAIERLDCVDLEPAVFELIEKHFRGEWLKDDRVRLVVEDGRSYVRHGGSAYDLISVEVGQIFRPGVAPFYTVEFYRDARRHLRPGGALCQFVPLPFFTPEEFSIVLRTFIEVFPKSVLWYNTEELLLIGFNGDHIGIDSEAVRTALSRESLQRDLEFRYWGSDAYRLKDVSVFVAGFLAGPRGLRGLAGWGEVYSDNRPFLECATRGPSEEHSGEISIAGELRSRLEAPGEALGFELAPGEANQAEEIRRKNLGDIAASAWVRRARAREGQEAPERILEMLGKALESNPESAEALRLLGDAEMSQGELWSAEAHYREALKLCPDDARLRRGMGVLLHRTGNLTEAIGHYRFVLGVRPLDAETHNNLGAALAAENNLGEALLHFETAAKLKPGFTDAHRNAARARAAMGLE